MSASTHLMVFSALGLVPPPSRVLAMHESQFEVVEPPKPKVEPPKIKEPEPPPPEPPKAQPRRAAPQIAAAPPPPTPPAAPPPEEVADLTGVTLTAEHGGWSSVVGSGAPLTGPVGKIGRSNTQAAQQSAKVGPVGPRVVALDSLSRKPSAPPGLDALLKRNYPRRASLQGVEGKVSVSLRILPNGRVTNFHVLQEDPSGFDFGNACRETLKQAPPFIAPLDRSGVPVAADIIFNCSFEVAY